jgi:Uma2 family endonuclease
MIELSFESQSYLTSEGFRRWLRGRARTDENRYELLNGRVVMTPPAGYPHGSVEAAIVMHLRGFVVSNALGHVFGSSQGFDLPSGDAVGADASFVSTARWEQGPSPEEGRFLQVVPDLVVEILSPSTASRDRGEKKAIYERNRVREYWLVDTRARTLRVFTLEGDRFDLGTVYEEGDTVSSHALPGFAAPLGELLGL